MSALPNGSHVNLFGHLECIIDLDAEVSRGALDLGMAEQQLNRPQVAGSAIDQRGLGFGAMNACRTGWDQGQCSRSIRRQLWALCNRVRVRHGGAGGYWIL
jgi:hypothetical protein